MYEIERTNNFRFQYNKLALKHKRFVEEAIEVIKETPTECQGKITHLSHKKTGHLYRFRMPGLYILYVVPNESEGVPIILTNVKLMY